LIPEEEPKPTAEGAVSPFPPPPGSKREVRKAVITAAKREQKAAWHGFPDLPGKHLTKRNSSRRSWELVNDATGTVEVRARCWWPLTGGLPTVVTHQGRTYEWREVGRSKILAVNRTRALVNTATHAPVLRLSGAHYNGSAGTRVTLVGQGELHFPVRWPRPALMSALDESEGSLVEYREIKSKHGSRFEYYSIEAVIRPTALTIPHIELLVAVSTGLMIGYFKTSGGS